MERTAAAQIWFGDQAADPGAKFVPQAFEFGLVGTQIKRLPPALGVDALFARKGNEADPRIAFVIGLAAGHGAGQPLLAVKAMPRGEDDVFARPAIERGPKSLLNGFATAGRPQNLFAARTAGLLRDRIRRASRWPWFRFRSRRCSAERHSLDECIGTIEAIQAQMPHHALPPAPGIVAQIHDQHARGEVGQLRPSGVQWYEPADRSSTAMLGVKVRIQCGSTAASRRRISLDVVSPSCSIGAGTFNSVTCAMLYPLIIEQYVRCSGF